MLPLFFMFLPFILLTMLCSLTSLSLSSLDFPSSFSSTIASSVGHISLVFHVFACHLDHHIACCHLLSFFLMTVCYGPAVYWLLLPYHSILPFFYSLLAGGHLAMAPWLLLVAMETILIMLSFLWILILGLFKCQKGLMMQFIIDNECII